MMRSDISQKNKYWIPKHRYYELKHFCLQYSDWVNSLVYLGELTSNGEQIKVADSKISDQTGNVAVKRLYFRNKMKLVEDAANCVEESLSKFILIAVTTGRSYDYMALHYTIPCGRDLWYENYRKFFYILNCSQ